MKEDDRASEVGAATLAADATVAGGILLALPWTSAAIAGGTGIHVVTHAALAEIDHRLHLDDGDDDDELEDEEGTEGGGLGLGRTALAPGAGRMGGLGSGRAQHGCSSWLRSGANAPPESIRVRAIVPEGQNRRHSNEYTVYT